MPYILTNINLATRRLVACASRPLLAMLLLLAIGDDGYGISLLVYRKLVAKNAIPKVWLFFITAGMLLIAAGFLFVRMPVVFPKYMQHLHGIHLRSGISLLGIHLL